MLNDLKDVIVGLANASSTTSDAGDAMKFTQAALNLCHASAVYVQTEAQVMEILDKRN